MKTSSNLFKFNFKVEHKQIFDDLTSSTMDPDMIKRNVFIHSDAYSATKNTHAIVVCTEWDEIIVIILLIVNGYAIK